MSGDAEEQKKIVVDNLRSTKNKEQDQYSLSGPDFAIWATKMTGHEAAYMGYQTVSIFCFHFLGHKKKSARNVFRLVMSVRVPVRILLSRTVSRRKQRGKTQGIENPVRM